MGSKQGKVRVSYPYKNQNTFKEISAHDGPIQIVKTDSIGKYLATASDKGTLIRIFDLSLIPQNGDMSAYSPICIFRRGMEVATICSIVFDSSSNWLCVSSNTETVHVFAIDLPSSALGWFDWGRKWYTTEKKSFYFHFF